MNFGLLGAGFGRLGASPRSGMSLSSLFAKYGGGMDFTDLDITKTWGPAGLKRYYSDNGVTPVSGSGQGVQLALSGDRGLVLGPELWAGQSPSISQGGYSSVGSWNAATLTMTNTGVGENTGYPRFDFNLGLTVGKVYNVLGRLDGDRTALTVVRLALSGANNPLAYNSTTGVFYGAVVAGGNSIEFVLDGTKGAKSLQIAELSVCEVLGNHAYQSTSGSRPQWQTGNKLVFDGVDDVLTSGFLPDAAMTLAFCGRSVATSSVGTRAMGAPVDTNKRCNIGMSVDGTGNKLVMGWGSTGEALLGPASILNSDVVGLMRGNASIIDLWQDGVKVATGTPSGSPSGNTNGISIGAQGASNFWNGRLYRAVVIPAFVTDAEALFIQRVLGASIVSF